MTKKLWIAVLAIAGLLALPILASAAHWPNFGGDAGHSGFQPVRQAALPIDFAYTANDAGAVRNSIITTAGPDPSKRFLAYGKVQSGPLPADDRADVHLRQLDTGAEKIADAARDVDDGLDDPNAFGPPPSDTAPRQGVSFVDTSTADGPGQLYVVHNDQNSAAQSTNPPCRPTTSSENDIAIAQFDEATGTKKRDVAVGLAKTVSAGECVDNAVSNGYTVESSPVITPPLDSSGTRWIYFLARKTDTTIPGPEAKLFGVRVDNAGSPNAVVHSDNPQVRDVAGANTLASPTLVYLNNPQPLVGGTRLYVAVPGSSLGLNGSKSIATYAVGNISDSADDGPTAPRVAGPTPTTFQTPQTISVPVTSGGLLPGQAGSGVSKAPALYVAFDNGSGATVQKFVQQGSSSNLTQAQGATNPVTLSGRPAPALAVTATATGTGEQAGRVILTTGSNLYLLDSQTVQVVEQLADDGEAVGEGRGFFRNTATASGNLIFVTDDKGRQAVLSLSDAEPVGSSFTENAANLNATLALGQPSYSNGFLQFLSDRGVFVYRTKVITQAPVADFTITPNPVKQGDTVTFDASPSKDPDGTIVRYELDLDGNGEFETDLKAEPKFSAPAGIPGTYNVGLRVTDNDGVTGTTTKQLTINPPPPNQNPTASFAIAPNPAKTGERVSFDARASKDPDGTIAKYEWDLDGNGSFETTTTTPTASRTFARAGVILAKLKVTDNRGGTAEATKQLVVTRAGRVAARRLTSRVRPRVDTTLPHRFRMLGRLVLRKSVPKSRGCRGRVTVVVKNGKETISRRTTKLRRTCRYSKRVTFSDAERLEGATSLRFKARFQGNRAVLPRQSKTRRARIK